MEGKSKSLGQILRDWQATKEIPLLSEVKRPLTSAQILVQSPASGTVPLPEIVQVTAVEAKPTEQGVEVILQTTFGEQLTVVNRSASNSYIADVPNAQLRLPSGDGFEFRSQKPITGITQITVTNTNANTVRVTVMGEAGVPQIELFDDSDGLIFAVTSAESATKPQQQPETQQQPTSETPQQPSGSTNDELIEVLVIREEDGYFVPEASTATRADTPIRDIPGSIQVIFCVDFPQTLDRTHGKEIVVCHCGFDHF